MRPRFALVLATLLSADGAPPAEGCAVVPDDELRVSASFDAVGDAEVELAWYRDGDGSCTATARIDASRLPSPRLAPRPRDVLHAVEGALARWHPATCAVRVVVRDDRTEVPWDALAESREEFRWDGADWRPGA